MIEITDEQHRAYIKASAALQDLMMDVDFTEHKACSLTEMVGAVCKPASLANANEALTNVRRLNDGGFGKNG